MRYETRPDQDLTFGGGAHLRAACARPVAFRGRRLFRHRIPRQRSGAGTECAGRLGTLWLRAGVHAVCRGDPAAALCARAHRGAAGAEAGGRAARAHRVCRGLRALSTRLDRLLEHIGGGTVPAPCLAVAHFRAARGLGRAAAAAQAFRRRYAGALEALPRAAYPRGGVLRL